MFNTKDIDSYIESLLIKEFKDDALFIMADKFSEEIYYVFQNPFEIVRLMWKEVVPYFENVQNNSLYFLYTKSYELGYYLSYMFLNRLIKNYQDVTKNDLNNAAHLFLLQHAVLESNLVYGYATIPDQINILKTLLKSIGFINIDDAVLNIIQTADDEEAYKIILGATTKIA